MMIEPHKQPGPSGPSEKQGALAGILFNLVIPILILNKGSGFFGERGPVLALLAALAFPLTYGIVERVKYKKKSILALVGIINILITGGLALFHFEGFWFAVKEGAVPLLVGLGILLSAFTRGPVVNLLLYNNSVMKVDLVKERLVERGMEEEFRRLLRMTTILLAMSFFMSAVLNFVLARQIFTEIAGGLSPSQKTLILNQQIAQMTWKSYVVIVLPSLAVTMGILFYLLRGIRKLTGLTIEEVIRS